MEEVKPNTLEMGEGIKPEEGVDIKPEENKEAVPEVEPEVALDEVPIQLKWENEFSIEVTFPDSTMGLLIFSPVAGVPCLYSGRLIDDTRHQTAAILTNI